jgi:hypothetical protein
MCATMPDRAISGAARRPRGRRRQQQSRSNRKLEADGETARPKSDGGPTPWNHHLPSSGLELRPPRASPSRRSAQQCRGNCGRGARGAARLADRYGIWLEKRRGSPRTGRAQRPCVLSGKTSATWVSVASHRVTHARISSGQKCVTRGTLVTVSIRLLKLSVLDRRGRARALFSVNHRQEPAFESPSIVVPWSLWMRFSGSAFARRPARGIRYRSAPRRQGAELAV